MEFNFDLINIALIFTFCLNTIYGLVVYSRNRNLLINKIFFYLTITVTFWILSMVAYRGTQNEIYSLIYSRILYLSALIIPATFLYFVLVYTNQINSISFYVKKLLFLPAMILGVISLWPDLLIFSVIINVPGEKIIVFNQKLHLIYGLYIAFYFLVAHYILYTSYLKSNGISKYQLRNIFIGTIIASVFGVVSNLMLPYIGIFKINWLGQIGILGMIIPIFYSIIKYNLFNVKIIVTEIFVFALWFILFSRIYISTETLELSINIFVFVLTLVIGLFLIKSVKKEILTREKIETLAKDLEKTNLNLENANDRLKELDQMKSEFVSLATHQIRSPLTAIKGYISLIQEGDYGPVSPEVKQAIDVVYQSTNNLVTIVGDFLDVSRIEQGRMKYDFKDFDIQELTNQVVTELKPNVEKRGLAINYSFESGKDYKIFADLGKIKQIIGNIVDNSIKYTPSGKIDVALLKPADFKVLIRISDTGVGINPKVLPKLFQKFTRADNANEVNILGTGLGLYVAKQMVEAHQGRVWAESDGEGKGSKFYIELPVKSVPPKSTEQKI